MLSSLPGWPNVAVRVEAAGAGNWFAVRGGGVLESTGVTNCG